MASLQSPLITAGLEQVRERLRERRQVTDDLVKLAAAHAVHGVDEMMNEEDVQQMYRKMKRLEAKLEQCSVNEATSFDALRNRLAYASAFEARAGNTSGTSGTTEQMRGVLRQREGVFLADYLARCGYYKTAEKLAEQRDVGTRETHCKFHAM